jgi:hypothetical protein
MSERRHPDPRVDAMDKWLERLYTGTLSDENETLKARVIELEAEIDLIPLLMPIPKSAEFRAGWVAGVKAYRDAIRERRAEKKTP